MRTQVQTDAKSAKLNFVNVDGLAARLESALKIEGLEAVLRRRIILPEEHEDIIPKMESYNLSYPVESFLGNVVREKIGKVFVQSGVTDEDAIYEKIRLVLHSKPSRMSRTPQIPTGDVEVEVINSVDSYETGYVVYRTDKNRPVDWIKTEWFLQPNVTSGIMDGVNSVAVNISRTPWYSFIQLIRKYKPKIL